MTDSLAWVCLLLRVHHMLTRLLCLCKLPSFARSTMDREAMPGETTLTRERWANLHIDWSSWGLIARNARPRQASLHRQIREQGRPCQSACQAPLSMTQGPGQHVSDAPGPVRISTFYPSGTVSMFCCTHQLFMCLLTYLHLTASFLNGLQRTEKGTVRPVWQTCCARTLMMQIGTR